MNLLALETGGPQCSACVFYADTVFERATDEPRAHASHVLPLVQAALADAGVALTDMHKLVFGEGPGGLTGLRVAASVVQGFALVTELPVVAVSNLEALALRIALARPAAAHICIAHDLGMDAVVWQVFAIDNAQGVVACAPAALGAPHDIDLPRGAVVLAGTAREVARAAAKSPVSVLEHAHATAADLARVAVHGGGKEVAVNAVQPLYWRHPVYG